MSNYKQIRDFRDSNKMNSVSVGAQNFFVRCFMEADDFGVLRGQPMLLRSLLWPNEEHIQFQTGGVKTLLNAEIVLGWIKECAKAGLIYAYLVDLKPYIQIIKFDQKGLTHPKSKYPLPTSSRRFPTFPDISKTIPEIEVEIEKEIEVEDELERERKGAEALLISRIVDCLNFVSSSSFKCKSQSSVKHITARLRENFTFEDFEKVIIYKTAQWIDHSEWNQYLRPQTLFGTKFESYLQAAIKETNKVIITKSEEIKNRILTKLNNELTGNN